jgi:NTE family protein
MSDNTNKKIGLALSGGGYRAAAYHIGTLRALNKLGMLNKVDAISSVSGGSIIAAYYALHKGSYEEFEQTFTAKLQKGVLLLPVVNLLLIIALFGVSVWLLGWWMLLPDFILLFFLWFKLLPFSIFIEKAYAANFFGRKKLSDFPAKPLVAMNSTDVATGTLFTFSQIKMEGYKYEGKDKKAIFKHENFPIARAVMASSCVPFAFSPVKISNKYCNVPFKKGMSKPLLIDGGLYDNQGAHKLTEKSSSYHTQVAIVSDAGAGEMSAKWAFNTPLMLAKTANIMMHRIKTFQLRSNIYADNGSGMQFAYLSLGWEVSDRPIYGFIQNLAEEHIAPELLAFHHIQKEDIDDLRSSDKSVRQAATERLAAQLKQNVGWSDLELIKPSPQEDSLAKSVGTNLTALKKNQIDALITHSSWLTEVQIRLYLPYLIAK